MCDAEYWFRCKWEWSGSRSGISMTEREMIISDDFEEERNKCMYTLFKAIYFYLRQLFFCTFQFIATLF